MFFDNWFALVRIVVVGVLAYLGLVILLRISGKRTLAKMNAFDLVVTVALGSTLATILLSKGVALVEGLLAFITLITLQFIIAWLSVRSKTVSNFVKSEPALLLYRGCILSEALQRERVTEGEVRAAVRQHGYGDLGAIEAVVLETDGSFSVVSQAADAPPARSALVNVQGFGQHANEEGEPGL